MQNISLSYHVADLLQRHGNVEEANCVRIVAQWHESSDGRGLSQLQRCRFNYQMLNFILEEWMPWYDECYDFSTIDINRYSYFFLNVVSYLCLKTISEEDVTKVNTV